MDMLEHMCAVMDKAQEALEKPTLDLAEEEARKKKELLLKLKAEMAFHQDDAQLQKEVAILHGKEMP